MAARGILFWPKCAGLLLFLPPWVPGIASETESYIHWEAAEFAILAPLGGLRGNAERGRMLVTARDKGNCLACHRLPIPEEPDQGNLGPPLHRGIRRHAGGGTPRHRCRDCRGMDGL